MKNKNKPKEDENEAAFNLKNNTVENPLFKSPYPHNNRIEEKRLPDWVGESENKREKSQKIQSDEQMTCSRIPGPFETIFFDQFFSGANGYSSASEHSNSFLFFFSFERINAHYVSVCPWAPSLSSFLFSCRSRCLRVIRHATLEKRFNKKES